MLQRLFAAVPVLVVCCLACGGKSSELSGDPSGGSSPGGTAGNASGGLPSSGGSQGGNGTDECAALLDDAPSFVPVTIVNESSETLYLGRETVSCGDAPIVEVADAAGRLLTPPAACRSSCENLMTTGPVGCPGICLLPSATELAPGESVSTSWSGTYVELVGLPKKCQSVDFPSAQCDRAVAIEPGLFVFSSRAGTKLDCSSSGGDCMPCVPGDGGGCVTSGARIAGSIRSAETKVELDASYGLTSGSADVALRAVEIRFVEP
jgi:hypothetical protein